MVAPPVWVPTGVVVDLPTVPPLGFVVDLEKATVPPVPTSWLVDT
jgi:hypothetical protein